MDYNFTLVLEMFNYKWDTVGLYLPLYETMTECQWWGIHLSHIFREYHDAIVFVNKCVAL